MTIVNSNFMRIDAAVADLNQGHYIEMPEFQPGMMDMLRRDYTILSRINATPATGYPSRYWEQTKLPDNSGFIDVRGGGTGYTGYSKDTLDEDYGRVEKSLYLKAIVSGIKFTLFDKEVVQQQGQMEFLLAKDMADMTVTTLRKMNNGLWNGAATTVIDTTSKEYCGIITQIGAAKATIASTDTTTKIPTVIREQVAKGVANTTWDARPTAIYANPMSIHILEEELSKEVNWSRNDSYMELVPGVRVPAIVTQAGRLPIIPDPFIPVASVAGKDTHSFIVMNESLLEYHYLTSFLPRTFKMGINTSLTDNYLQLAFGAPVLKGVQTGSHFIVKKEVATA